MNGIDIVLTVPFPRTVRRKNNEREGEDEGNFDAGKKLYEENRELCDLATLRAYVKMRTKRGEVTNQRMATTKIKSLKNEPIMHGKDGKATRWCRGGSVDGKYRGTVRQGDHGRSGVIRERVRCGEVRKSNVKILLNITKSRNIKKGQRTGIF